MKILALETTEPVGGVAAIDDRKLLLHQELDSEVQSAQSLAPAIRRLLDRVGWRPGDVELVAVSIGPGSFTGLRVGVTTAKTFAYAVQADVLGVDTLEVVAAGLPSEIDAVSVATDAQRGQVVARNFQRGPDGWFQPTGPEQLLDAAAWLADLDPGTPIAGPVLRKLVDRLPDRAAPVAPQYWAPSATWVGRLAARHCAARHDAAGDRGDLWKLVPRYSRPSAAEEKWAKGQSASGKE